jgi:hypothetical protein
MAKPKKFDSPTVLKNFRIPAPLNDWFKRKSKSSGVSQTDLLLQALKSKHPELKGILS